MLKCYEEEVRIIEKSMNTNANVNIGRNEINDLVKELFSLPINGEQLRQCMEVALASKNRMRATYSQTHFSSRKYTDKLIKNTSNMNLKPSAEQVAEKLHKGWGNKLKNWVLGD